MSTHDLAGYYTYRSFLNRPTGRPEELLWGEGELLLFVDEEGSVSGTLAFPADAGERQKSIMDVSGRISGWSPLSLRFIGKGRQGSDIEDFEYEYDCREAHTWDTSEPPQRISLVGTVRRNKDHGQAKAGATASFVAVKRDFLEPRDIELVKLIPATVSMLAERTHRLRHLVWHSVREIWNNKSTTEEDRQKLRGHGWGLDDPPRDGDGRLILTNGAGEDFLYMHRRMIAMVHEIYANAGKTPPRAWARLPSPTVPQLNYVEASDSEDPSKKVFVLDPDSSGDMVPPAVDSFMEQVQNTPFFRFNKTPRGYSSLMRQLESSLRNPRVMVQLPLGAYGNLIEYTVHNWMHMRWATTSRDPETGKPRARGDFEIDGVWNDPRYDYLGDFYSSHVNPLFWRLHGWVDECIEAWFTAHQEAHAGEVVRKQIRGIAWFEEGAWVVKKDPFDWPGAGGAHGHGQHSHGHGTELETLLRVVDLLREIGERQPAAAELRAAAPRRMPGFARASLDFQ